LIAKSLSLPLTTWAQVPPVFFAVLSPAIGAAELQSVPLLLLSSPTRKSSLSVTDIPVTSVLTLWFEGEVDAKHSNQGTPVTAVLPCRHGRCCCSRACRDGKGILEQYRSKHFLYATL
jgi:hypothetical protein